MHACVHVYMSRDMIKPTKEDSDQPPLCAQWVHVAKDPSFLHENSEDSEWADAQADLSLRWAHSQFVGFVMLWLICVCACV